MNVKCPHCGSDKAKLNAQGPNVIAILDADADVEFVHIRREADLWPWQQGDDD